MPERRLDPDRFPDGEHRRSLEQAVGEYVERIIGGEKIDPLEIFESYPELAPDILRELDTFESIESAGRTSPNDEPLGTLGDYALRRQIGRGGMGVVYEAWENSLERRVALKVLPAGIAADARSSTRFLREAQIAAKLSHPQIVAVHATGIKEGTCPYRKLYPGEMGGKGSAAKAARGTTGVLTSATRTSKTFIHVLRDWRKPWILPRRTLDSSRIVRSPCPVGRTESWGWTGICGSLLAARTFGFLDHDPQTAHNYGS